MSRPRLSAAEALKDIRAGKDDAFLMQKFALSAAELLKLFQKLMDAGLLSQAEIDARVPIYERTVEISRDAGFPDKRPTSRASGPKPVPKPQAAPIKTSASQPQTPPAEDQIISAAKKGDLKAIETRLRAGVSANVQGQWGMTPLMWAASKGRVKAAELLVARGAKVNFRANNRSTALMWAAFAGHTAMVEFLLNSGADANAASNQGRTALMSACHKGHTEIVTLLLQKGADIGVKDAAGKSAIAYAKENGDKSLLAVLSRFIQHGMKKSALRPAGSR